jgi:hypothetical protein
MAKGSVWIRSRPTKAGAVRHRVEYRLGGREAPTLFGGSFGTKREASIRKVWILNEIAAGRAPDLNLVAVEKPQAPTLAEAAETWKGSRVDVEQQTQNMHRSAWGRIFKAAPELRSRRVDEVTADDVAELIAALARPRNGRKSYRRETIKKSRDALAMTLDFYGIDPNPGRDKRVKLPKERKAHVPPRSPSTSSGSQRRCRGITSYRCLSSTSAGLGLASWRRLRSATWTSTAARSASAGRSRRTTATGISTYRMISSPRSWRRCPPARTAT